MEIKEDTLYVASRHNLLLIDLISTTIIESIYVPESEYLGHIALDSSHYVFVTDWSARKLFRINLIDYISTTLHTFNSTPVGLSYEENNDRLILLTLVSNAPILAYNLTNGYIDTVRVTNVNDPDAICRDTIGNYYVTSFTENIVYRFGYDFFSGPEIISTGHDGPSGIGYNMRENVIGVTNYNFNSIDLIQLEPSNAEFEKNFKLKEYILSQNYPNPFNPTTTIKFTIPILPVRQAGSPLNPSPYQGEGNRERLITLKVYDVLGNEIATLVNEEKPVGNYEITWYAENLASGIYFYRLQGYPANGKAGSFVETKKMVLLR
jgi:hypothetical protein